MQIINPIRYVLFDFGGVIAEEGFREGLRAIAVKNRLDADIFINTAHEIIYASGYLTGKVPESAFWNELREQTGIRGEDGGLRDELLSRFIIRDGMLVLADDLKRRGIGIGILSDQTDWLDMLDQRYGFFRHFDRVFNSYYMGDSKKNPAYFDCIVALLNIPAPNVLFIDDAPGNCERASSRGLQVIQYINKNDFLKKWGQIFTLDI